MITSENGDGNTYRRTIKNTQGTPSPVVSRLEELTATFGEFGMKPTHRLVYDYNPHDPDERTFIPVSMDETGERRRDVFDTIGYGFAGEGLSVRIWEENGKSKVVIKDNDGKIGEWVLLALQGLYGGVDG